MKRFYSALAAIALCGIWLARAEDAPAAAPDAAAQVKTDAAAKPALPGHCLAIKDGKAMCCACGAECKCTMGDDKKMCTCGKPITAVDVAGKYVCEMCCQVSDKAGKCPKCGGEMKQVPAKPAEAPKAE